MTATTGPTMTYKQAGVDVDEAERLVDVIRPLVERTRVPRMMGSIGGFAGLFRLDYDENIFRMNYREPVLVACTDGVGTKIRVAIDTGRLNTVGIDLVAMSVNDLICCGAEPLFFLDYLAVGALRTERIAEIVKGVSDGCARARCALLGGETAEMPDFYAPKEFDMAGFAVGVVERGRIIDGANMQPGDVVIALASDGLHSNGFGLARRALLGRGRFKLTDCPPELGGASVADELLRPTRIYVRPILRAIGPYRVKRVVRAMANITGGGIAGNLQRIVPDGLTLRLKRSSWAVPPIFDLIAAKGPVDPIEMMRVFNMGVGFVMIASRHFAPAIINRLRRAGERCWVLGKVREGPVKVQWT